MNILLTIVGIITYPIMVAAQVGDGLINIIAAPFTGGCNTISTIKKAKEEALKESKGE